MNNIDVSLNKKQLTTMNILYNSLDKNVVIYGGAAGGGKSYLGCLFIITYCLKYPEIRCMIGRYTIASIKSSTIVTFIDILKKYNITYEYNISDKIIKFENGSIVKFQQLAELPSDPEYDYLGSNEYTAVFVDEFTQITYKCYNIIQTRIRYKLKEYNLRPLLLLTCNPSNNWVKEKLYDKFINDTLNDNVIFIPASIEDNKKNLTKEYIDGFDNLDEQTKQRLRYGNWDYNVEDNQIFDMSVLYSLFNKKNNDNIKEYYLSIDVARFGNDKTVIILWNKYHVCNIFTLSKQDLDTQYHYIVDIIRKYNIKILNVVIDTDGVGGGLADRFKGCVNLVNNSKAFKNENFNNLKTQLYFKAAELVNNSIITFDENISDDIKSFLIQELNFVVKKEQKADEKIQIENKDYIKKKINRSPDYSDAFAYRFYYEYKNFKFSI